MVEKLTLIAVQYPIVWVYHKLFIHSNVKEPSGNFQIGLMNPLLVFGPPV